MSRELNVAVGQRNSKRITDAMEQQKAAKLVKIDEEIVDKQLQTDEEKAKASQEQAELHKHLKEVLAISKLFLEARRAVERGVMCFRIGLAYHGTPDLGSRVQSFLELHGKNITAVLPRNLATLTASRCAETFDRAVCFAPSIILFIGLEHAATDVQAVLQQKMKENSNRCTRVIVVATTGVLPESLKDWFGVIKLQELEDPQAGPKI